MTEPTVVLLGDSILDNAPYTAPEPDTTEHLRRMIAPEGSVELLARDGATIRDVGAQLEELEGFPDVAVLSVGGNDALGHLGLLERPVSSASAVLEELLAIADDFVERYEEVARAVAERAARTVLCTIYEVALEPPPLAELARAPLAVLNDRIVRVGARLGADVLELRSVCTEAEDFVMQIEPSAQGAEKIAGALARVVREDASLRSARVMAADPDRP